MSKPLLFVVLSLLLSLGALPLSAQIVINEVDTGATDWIEIANLGQTTFDLSGWHFIYFEDVQTPNGAGFVFPGAPGSGTVTLAPNELLVLTDSPQASLPVVPAGVAAFYVGFGISWNAGEAGSALLADEFGNGIDYWAHGNPNLFLCPQEASTFFNLGSQSPALAGWSGEASPEFGAINSLDVHARQVRSDSNSAADFTMLDAARATPGQLNDFQLLTNADGLPPTAAFSASVLSGVSPLTVTFSNESSGDCALLATNWDFDVGGVPGSLTASSRNASFTFTTPPGAPPGSSFLFDVVLTVADICLGTSTSNVATVIVTAPDPLVAQSVNFTETFEGPPGPDGLNARRSQGWDIRLPDPASRARTIDPRNFGAATGYTDATLNSGPTALVLDSSTNTTSARQDVVLHLDGDAIFAATGSQEFRVRLWLYSNGDELDADDLICFQDGVTMGNGVNRQGMSTGQPGLDGLQEIFLVDWHAALGVPFAWREVELVFDTAFFAQHPSLALPGSGNAQDYRLIIRHRDDFGFSGTNGDGLIIDKVRVFGPSVPGPGESGVPGVARFDLNDATNANGNPVGTAGDESGPFFTTATSGSPIVFRFEGQPNQPILLLAGTLNPGAAAYPVGQLDIGGIVDPMTGVPAGLTILADGTQQDFVNSLFNTTVSGTQIIQFVTPSLPPGFLTTIQAVIYNPQTVIQISNAVQFEVL